jgi:NTE family protein/lysophospholipid hydrolase
MSGWPHLARALDPRAKGDAFPNIAQILMRTAMLSSLHNQDAMRELADLYIHPPTDDKPLFAWAAIDEFVDIGYRHSYDLIQQWMLSDARHTGLHAAIRRTGTWDV